MFCLSVAKIQFFSYSAGIFVAAGLFSIGGGGGGAPLPIPSILGRQMPVPRSFYIQLTKKERGTRVEKMVAWRPDGLELHKMRHSGTEVSEWRIRDYKSS